MKNNLQINEIKRKIRNLKHLEEKIRFGGNAPAGYDLVWNRFFDLRNACTGKAKYSLADLVSLSKEQYKLIVDEYLALVYYEIYKSNGAAYARGHYDPALLEQLGLPLCADEQDIKRRFRELALKYHPDTGGDAGKFISLMENYRKILMMK